jgi:hypothetical protein
MQISKFLSPRAETKTGKGMDSESGTATKSETRKELRREAQNNWQELSCINAPTFARAQD